MKTMKIGLVGLSRGRGLVGWSALICAAPSPDFSPQVRTALRYWALPAALHHMQRGVIRSKVRQHRREACATTRCGAGGFLITALPW